MYCVNHCLLIGPDAGAVSRPPGLRRWLLVLLCLGLMLGTARAATFEEGLAASQRGDHALAARIWLPLAEAGDPLAQFGLGTLYHEGLGLPLDLVESAYWFHEAAEQGLAEAQYNLGNAYKEGEGVGQSDTMAVHWWRRSAEQGFALAQFNLGTAIYFGRGVPADPTEGLEWYRKAAAQGHPLAQNALAENPGAGPAPARAASPIAHPAPAAPPDEAPDCMTWLEAQPPGAFTIQLLASPWLDKAQAVARQLPADHRATVCSYDRDGQRWHVVLYGSFDGPQQARTAHEQMPVEFQAESPWIRKLAGVKRLVQGN